LTDHFVIRESGGCSRGGGSKVPDTLVIEADMAGLIRASAWAETVATRLALPSTTAFGLNLCVEEAISNIIRHGFGGAAPNGEDIHLTVAATPRALTLTIADRAPAFDPRGHIQPAHPAAVEAARVGGMGIHLMRQFAEALEYERRDGMNRLTLRFGLPAAPA